MKAFWISSLILTAGLVALLFNAQHLQTVMEPLQAQLQAAEQYAIAEEWDSAMRLMEAVQEGLEGQALYLHITLPHKELDQIALLVLQANADLKRQASGDYQMMNQILRHRLRLLYEMEALTLQNLF